MYEMRFTLLSAFSNFIKNSLDPDFRNPCDNPPYGNYSGPGDRGAAAAYGAFQIAVVG
jgi:hypothetical protein